MATSQRKIGVAISSAAHDAPPSPVRVSGEQAQTGAKVPARGNVRLRALLLGAACVVGSSYLIAYAELVLASIRIGYLQLPPVALGLLVVLVGLNNVLRGIARRLALTESDLLVVYGMMVVGAMVSSHGVVEKLVPQLVITKYWATNNNWHDLFDPHIPRRLVPYDTTNGGQQFVANAFYDRMPRGDAVPWKPWLVPIANWSVLLGLIVWAYLCLAAILRKQWTDHEKLPFPLAQLPLEIASEHGQRTFWGNPIMWLGASIPAVIYAVKGLHLIFPPVPDIPLHVTLNDYLTAPPWNTLVDTEIYLSFAAIGFFALLPADVLFSVWLFFLLTRLEQLVAISYNMHTPLLPLYSASTLFSAYQTVGANFVLVGYFFYTARPHLRKVWAMAVGRQAVDDSQEILPYRVAVWGLLGAMVGSAIWLHVMGMSLWLAAFELVIYLLVIIPVMARSVAELGMLMTETTFRPIDVYRMFAPVQGLGHADLTMMAFFDNMVIRDQRGLLITGFLDGARIADGVQVSRRSFVPVFALGMLVAFLVSTALNIVLPYTHGGWNMDWWMEIGSPKRTFEDFALYMTPGQPPLAGDLWQCPTFFVVGLVVTLFLVTMRMNFYWWPLHPLGYALAGSFTTREFWFACLVAWAIKASILRYGGMRFHTRARPFFLGLVLGEFGMACLFVVLSFFKVPVPPFPWG